MEDEGECCQDSAFLFRSAKHFKFITLRPHIVVISPQLKLLHHRLHINEILVDQKTKIHLASDERPKLPGCIYGECLLVLIMALAKDIFEVN